MKLNISRGTFVKHFIISIFIALGLLLVDSRTSILLPFREIALVAINNVEKNIFYLKTNLIKSFSYLVNDNETLEVTMQNKIDTLTIENKLLRAQNQHSSYLEQELKNLNTILEQVSNYRSLDFQIAQIISYKDYFQKKNITLNKGLNHQIKIHDAVIDDLGLVGQIDRISDNYSGLMLITNLDSKIPVKIMPSGALGILVQDNKGLKVQFIKKNIRINVGDMILTSGLGEVFPKGIKVAKVTKISDNDPNFLEIQAAAVSRLEKNQYLLIIKD